MPQPPGAEPPSAEADTSDGTGGTGGSPSISLVRARRDEQLARPDEPVRPPELAERRLDLGPRRVALAGIEPREHLVEGAERLALEAGALRRRLHDERRLHAAHLDLREARGVELLADRGARERPREPRRRRRQRRPPPDDPDRDREERVPVGLGEDDRGVAAAGAERPAYLRERGRLVRHVHQPEPRDRRVERTVLDVE